MKKIIILLVVMGLFGCKSEDKYQAQHGWKGKVKKVTITDYEAINYNGLINKGDIITQSYTLFDETGKKVDGFIDFSDLRTDEFWDKMTTKQTEIDNNGNCTEKITYYENGKPYSITIIDIQYYN